MSHIENSERGNIFQPEVIRPKVTPNYLGIIGQVDSTPVKSTPEQEAELIRLTQDRQFVTGICNTKTWQIWIRPVEKSQD